MSDHQVALGLASQYKDGRLSASIVRAETVDGGDRVEVLDPWHGAARTSLAHQLFDLYERLLVVVDSQRPSVLAVRRPESQFGASKAHDGKVCVMAIVMLTARQHRLDVLDLRSNQLRPRADSTSVTKWLVSTQNAPDLVGAVAAALTAVAP
jgi:hypothetical protein